MRTASLLRRLFGDESDQLSKNERALLEAILFSQTSKGLEDDFSEKQVNLREVGLFRCLISDLLSSGEYTIEGIAQYTGAPFDVIDDIALGCNKNPSFLLGRKIIDLHLTARMELYNSLFRKLFSSITQ